MLVASLGYESRLVALVPSRNALPANHEGASYLRRAGFNVRSLVGHASIFDAYSHGVAEAAPADEDIVLLVHDDVGFDASHRSFVANLRRHLAVPRVGFVGAAGTRNLSRSLVWWRADGSPSATTLAGVVRHDLDPHTSERSFFGPFGRVVVLDGLLLAATGRTLRSLRLEAPAVVGAKAFHFYDTSYTLQASAAGLTNVALHLGVRHASKGKTDGVWERQRVALADRLAPLVRARRRSNPPRLKT